MRSVVDIIAAVEAGQPASVNELRRALLALASVEQATRRALADLATAAEGNRASARFKAQEARRTLGDTASTLAEPLRTG